MEHKIADECNNNTRTPKVILNKDQSQATQYRSYKTHSILINAIKNTIYINLYFIISLLTVE